MSDVENQLDEAAIQTDAQLANLFREIVPDGDFEDRMIDAVRQTRRLRLRIYIPPAVRKAALGVAAAVMLGGFGYVATNAVQQAESNRVKAASNLRQIGPAVTLYANEGDRF